MTHTEIKQAYAEKVTFTYAKIVVDFRPQKEDPYRIRTTAGGNLLTYKGNVSTRMVDQSTSKLLWNSVLSMDGAKFVCLGIKNFYLTAALDYFEYMQMPLSVFPEWVKKQYKLDEHAQSGFCVLMDGMRSLGPTAGRDTCQQTPQEMARPTWIL
jgi:hypothetical protein